MFNTGIVSLAGKKKQKHFRQTFYLQYPKSIIGIMNTTFMIFELCGSKQIWLVSPDLNLKILKKNLQTLPFLKNI